MVELSWSLLERAAYGQLNFCCYTVIRTFMSWVVHGDALQDLELGRESVPRYKNYLGPFI